MKHVMFNPLANNKRGYENALKVKALDPLSEYNFVDITKIESYADFFEKLPKKDIVIFTGGDGTIHRFVNDLGDYELKRELLYYPAGSGNDFMNDVKASAENGMIVLNDYIKDLPVVTVHGKNYKVLNGVGFGLDGYCCEEGDRVQRESTKPVNYTYIALMGVLKKYKPTRATVTVDGETHVYEKTWIAPAMNGRFFGGGMMITPFQDRLNIERSITSVILSGASRLKILTAFPKIFKGTHTNIKGLYFFKGHEVKVEFDEPRALQIDGETILGVTEYIIKSAALMKKKKLETLAEI